MIVQISSNEAKENACQGQSIVSYKLLHNDLFFTTIEPEKGIEWTKSYGACQ